MTLLEVAAKTSLIRAVTIKHSTLYNTYDWYFDLSYGSTCDIWFDNFDMYDWKFVNEYLNYRYADDVWVTNEMLLIVLYIVNEWILLDLCFKTNQIHLISLGQVAVDESSPSRSNSRRFGSGRHKLSYFCQHKLGRHKLIIPVANVGRVLTEDKPRPIEIS